MPTQIGFNHYDLLLWLSGLGTTLLILLLSSFFGMIIGGMLALIRFYRAALAAPVVRAISELLRNSPIIVQLFLVYFGIPMFFGIRMTEFTAASIVLTTNTAAFMSVVFLSALDSVDRVQASTARTFGLSELTILNKILVPQAILVAVPLTVGILVNQAQVTSLISVIGVADLTRVGHILNQKTFEPFIVWPAIGATYLVISLLIAWLGRKIVRHVNRPGTWASANGVGLNA